MRRLSVALLTIALAASLVACGTSGRELRIPQDGAVSPTRSTSTQVTVPTTPVAPIITLATGAFPDGGAIPVEYSCTGPSPALSWTGVTPAVKELALIVVDPEADGFVHWLVTGIKPTNASLPKGQVPPGATQHPNSAGQTGWSGPCPPAGTTHTYNFILLGLAQASALAPDLPIQDAIAALQTKARGNTALITGTFTGVATGSAGTGSSGSAVAGSAVTPTTAKGATTTSAATASTPTTARATTTKP